MPKQAVLIERPRQSADVEIFTSETPITFERIAAHYKGKGFDIENTVSISLLHEFETDLDYTPKVIDLDALT